MEWQYDEERANRPIEWIESYCTHVKGSLAGSPLILDKWQRDDILKPAFGWVHPETKRRKHRIVYVELPRGNAKSTTGSAIGLYLLIGDKEPASEVYSVAGSREQARMLFDPSKMMVLQDSTLKQICKVQDKMIIDKEYYGRFRVISADANRQHGQNPSGILFDEIHVQPNRDLWDTMTSGMTKREQAILFALTTAGVKETFAEEIHDYAIQVRDGIIEDSSFLSVIYAADPDDDPFDPDVWKKANPGWNFINQEAFAMQAKMAKNQPSYLNTFKRLHLNIWTGSQDAWIPVHEWDACNTGVIDMEALKGQVCHGGLDIADNRDLSSLCLMFPEVEGIPVIWFFWCPGKHVHTRSAHNIKYDKWVEKDYIIPCGEDAQDHAAIERKILELNDYFDIKSIEYDRKYALQIVKSMEEGGLNMHPYGQGYISMTGPARELERLIIKRSINHGGNPVMRWQMSNVQMVEDDAGNVKPSKKRSKDKIDGVVAMLMAFGGWIINKSLLRELTAEDFGI